MLGHAPDAALTWIGAERAGLEDQRARIERHLAALAEVETAVGRYWANR
jgi:hypothetical protein